MTQGTGRTSSWRATGTKILLAFVVLGSLAACAEVPGHASSPSAEPSVVFPDPASAAIAGGVFVDTSKLAQVQPGLARSQVYALIGMPHFREGMDASHWNYVFNYRDDADQVQQCQFLVAFDTDDRVNDMHWQPDGCQERLLAKATKTPPVARWQPKAPVVATLPLPPPPPPAPAPAPAPVPAAPVSAVPATVSPPPPVATTAAPAAAPVEPTPAASPPMATPPPPVATTAAAPVATTTPQASPSTTTPPASDVTLAATSQASLPSPGTAPGPAVPTAAPTPAAIPAPAPVPAPAAQALVASSAATASAPLTPMPPLTLSSDAAFAPGSAKLTQAGRERLDMMLLSVQVPTQFHDLQVVGFSDRTGTAKNNLKLSQRRAEAVRRYLVEGGVPADSITAIGKGEREPKAECGKKKGKALSECLAPDRRVEINGLAPPDAILQ